MSWGNYLISFQQVLNSLTFQGLKLFNVLNLEQSFLHYDDCCTEKLEEHEIDALNKFVEESSKLNWIERSSWYYIYCYVAHKKKTMIMNTNEIESKTKWEFLTNMTKGEITGASYNGVMVAYNCIASKSMNFICCKSCSKMHF